MKTTIRHYGLPQLNEIELMNLYHQKKRKKKQCGFH